jgi:hypothetical protein
MNKNFTWLMLFTLGIVFFCFGCTQKTHDGKVVAKVNNYSMTVQDLEDEIEHSPYSAEKENSPENILDLAIRKQVLIQEAQRQGLDRKKSFMKTIERYWEQTLIKELIQKEALIISQGVSKDKQSEALNSWMEGLYKKANIEINKEALEEIKAKE